MFSLNFVIHLWHQFPLGKYRETEFISFYIFYKSRTILRHLLTFPLYTYTIIIHYIHILQVKRLKHFIIKIKIVPEEVHR